MKKHLLATIGTILSLTSALMTPGNAHAVLIIENSNGLDRNPFTWTEGSPIPADSALTEGLACLVLLPLCVLDQKTLGGHSSTAKELAANGYSPEEIEVIMKDQSTIAAKLQAKGIALKFSQNDTKQSVEADIRRVDPEVSQTYIDYVTGAAAMK